MSVSWIAADTLGFFVELSLVVLEREPELLNRFVARLERLDAMSTEIVTRALEIGLGPLEGRDRLTNLWMAFEPNSPSFLDRSGLLWDGGELIHRYL